MIAPYLIFGFDVDPTHPNPAAVLDDVERNFPPLRPVPLGLPNLYAVEVPQSRMIARFKALARYLDDKDRQHGRALRWTVQLCRSPELAGG